MMSKTGKIHRYALALLLCLAGTLSLPAQPKDKPKGKTPKQMAPSRQQEPVMQPVAMFGVGVSFTDSVVYQTELQMVDSAWIHPSHKFLEDRTLYSLQLQYYMESQGIKNSICTILFDSKKNRLQRKWRKVNRRHQKKEAQHFKVVPLSDFKFKAEEYRPVQIGE